MSSHLGFIAWGRTHVTTRSPRSLPLRIALIAALLTAALCTQGRADTKPHYRNSCKVWAKYKLDGSVGCSNDSHSKFGDVDRGCGYASLFLEIQCSDSAIYSSGHSYARVDQRIGSGAYSHNFKTGSGLYGPAGLRGKTMVAPPPTPRVSRSDFVPRVVFDSLAETITVTLDSLRLAASKDSTFTLLEVSMWAGTSATDSIETPDKVFWTAGVRLQNGQLVTYGALSPADFTLQSNADSVWVSATHLQRIVSTAGSLLSLQRLGSTVPLPSQDNVEVTILNDGGFGSQAVTSVPSSSPMTVLIVAGGLLLIGLLRFRTAGRGSARSDRVEVS